jgi:PAS domain S-box-containing protein
MNITLQLIYLLFFIFGIWSIILVKKNYSKKTKNFNLILDDSGKVSNRFNLYLIFFGFYLPVSELVVHYYQFRGVDEWALIAGYGTFCLFIVVLGHFVPKIKSTNALLFRLLYIVFLLHSIYNTQHFLNESNYVVLYTLGEFIIVLFLGIITFPNLKQFSNLMIFITITCLSFATYMQFDIKLKIEFIILFLFTYSIGYVKYVFDNNLKASIYKSFNTINSGTILSIGLTGSGHIEYASDHFLTLIGEPFSAFLGKSWEQDFIQKYKILKAEMNNKYVQKINLEGGKFIYIEWTKELIENKLTVLYGIDISQRIDAELSLKKSNNRLKSLLANTGDMVFVLDKNAIVIESFLKSETEYPVTTNDLMNKSINTLVLPEGFKLSNNWITGFATALQKAVAIRNTAEVETSVDTPDGITWQQIKIAPIFDNEGNFEEFIAIVTIIDERKKAEEKIKYLSSLYEILLQNIPGIMFCKNRDGQLLFANKNYAQLFGKSTEEITNYIDTDLLANVSKKDIYLKQDLEVIETGKPLFIPEELSIDKAGNKVYYEMKKIPINLPTIEKRVMLGIVNDITERKKNEVEIIKINSELSTTLDQIKQANEQLENRNTEIHNLLELNERTLFSKVLKISTFSEIVNQVSETIETLLSTEEPIKKSQLQNIERSLRASIDEEESIWKEFKIQFEQTRPEYFKLLSEKAPDLSINDLKHCSYIIAKLNVKEVANLLNISTRSVETTRYRIKKKLKLDNDESLFNFLNKL